MAVSDVTGDRAPSRFPRTDLLVVGAGPAGCVVAGAPPAPDGRRSSSSGIRTSPGTATTCCMGTGVLVHAYGPHYFRTDRLDTVAYLSRFTEWVPARYVVKSRVGAASIRSRSTGHTRAILRAVFHPGAGAGVPRGRARAHRDPEGLGAGRARESWPPAVRSVLPRLHPQAVGAQPSGSIPRCAGGSPCGSTATTATSTAPSGYAGAWVHGALCPDARPSPNHRADRRRLLRRAP